MAIFNSYVKLPEGTNVTMKIDDDIKMSLWMNMNVQKSPEFEQTNP